MMQSGLARSTSEKETYMVSIQMRVMRKRRKYAIRALSGIYRSLSQIQAKLIEIIQKN